MLIQKALEMKTAASTLSRGALTNSPNTSINVRLIGVKDRSTVEEMFLSLVNILLGKTEDDNWLYVVYNCLSKPELYAAQKQNWDGKG